ncbi:MAG: hypothetical protein EOP85_05870, partial [Verrucomicrobiaceae bacterium]
IDGTANPTQLITAGEIWVGSTPASAGTLDLVNTTVTANNWLAVGRGNGVAAGSTPNVSTLNVTGSTLNVVNLSTGFANGLPDNTGTQNITFTNSTFNNTGASQIGEGRGSTANITATGTSVLNTREARVAMGGGAVEGATAATVTLQNTSIWNVGTEAAISFASVGFDGGTGTLIVKDSAQFINYDDFSLAEAGTATGNLIIQDNGKVTVRTALLGRGADGTALVTQTGGAFANRGNFVFQIGVSGKATYNLNGGTLNTFGRTDIARNGTSVSSLNVSGGIFTHNSTAELLHVAPAGNGTLSVSGTGQVASSNGMYVADEASGVGTINQTGGSINIARNVIFGQNGKATVNLSGGVFSMRTGTTDDVNFVVGNNITAQATLNISDTAQVRLANNASLRLGNTNSNDNVVNQTGGSVTFYSDNVTTVGGTGKVVIGRGTTTGTNTYNLAGGTLTTSSVTSEAPTSVSKFILNGGTLKASGNSTTFVQGLAAVEVNGGGAIIDSNTFNVTVVNALTAGAGTGGLTKNGAGVLTLSGLNTYVGNTVINAGGVTLADNAQLRFLLGANGVNNSVTGTGTLTLDGDFLIQNVAGSIGNGNSWTLIASSVNKSYGASFSIPGYTKSGNTWTRVDGANTWTYTESTGVLTLATGGVTDPYTTWTNTYFPGVTDQNIIGRNADPDGDGSSNALEFALGGVPNNGANGPKVYNIQADGSVDTDTDKELLLTIAVRSATPAFAGSPSPTAAKNGVTYTIQGSLDLTGFSTGVTPVDVVAPASAPTPPAGYEYRTFSLN